MVDPALAPLHDELEFADEELEQQQAKRARSDALDMDAPPPVRGGRGRDGRGPDLPPRGKPNTSRPASKHVDDYMAGQAAGAPKRFANSSRAPSKHVDDYQPAPVVRKTAPMAERNVAAAEEPAPSDDGNGANARGPQNAGGPRGPNSGNCGRPNCGGPCGNGNCGGGFASGNMQMQMLQQQLGMAAAMGGGGGGGMAGMMGGGVMPGMMGAGMGNMCGGMMGGAMYASVWGSAPPTSSVGAENGTHPFWPVPAQVRRHAGHGHGQHVRRHVPWDGRLRRDGRWDGGAAPHCSNPRIVQGRARAPMLLTPSAPPPCDRWAWAAGCRCPAAAWEGRWARRAAGAAAAKETAAKGAVRTKAKTKTAELCR